MFSISRFVANFPTPVFIQCTLHGMTISVIPGILGTAGLPGAPDLVGESGLSDVSTVPGLSSVPSNVSVVAGALGVTGLGGVLATSFRMPKSTKHDRRSRSHSC